MGMLQDLVDRHAADHGPFLYRRDETLSFHEVLAAADDVDLSDVGPGDVVALIGDFERQSIMTMLRLLDAKVVLVPLTRETRALHPYFFETAHVDVVIEGAEVRRLKAAQTSHPLVDALRATGHPGLVLFSSGTTGRPKAILHDFDRFKKHYDLPRPSFRTMTFLLFDHIGGINTLLHTLYNRGCVVVPSSRLPQAVMDDMARHDVELLPATPTFLRMLLMSGLLDQGVPPSLRVITYGSERMDQGTLTRLCDLLPQIDFRQYFGMSELGIMRVKSRARDSLWMRIGGEGITIAVVDGILKIKAEHRMLGYLNAPSPFDPDGWYDTKDIVEQDGEFIRVVGRNSEVISVGGIKFLPGEVEAVTQSHPDVALAKATGVENPITGQHVELTVELAPGAATDRAGLRAFLAGRLNEHMLPHRIVIGKVPVGHRFKSR